MKTAIIDCGNYMNTLVYINASLDFVKLIYPGAVRSSKHSDEGHASAFFLISKLLWLCVHIDETNMHFVFAAIAINGNILQFCWSSI